MTNGQIEALAADVVNKFLLEAVGRGPSATTATLSHGMLVVHLRDVLTPAEKCLAKAGEPERDHAEAMVRGIRDRIVRAGRDELAAALRDSIGHQPAAVLHDTDPASGDEVLIFTFAAPLANRAAAPRSGDRRRTTA